MQAVSAGTANPRSGGFTLIELLVVVAIIGILASIAIPSYNDYIRRAKLTDGIAVFADYRVKLEQYFQDNRNYGPAGGACGVAGPDTSVHFNYACVVGAAPAGTFVVTATSVAGSGLGAAGAFVYTLNEQNSRATTVFKGAAVAKNCWLKTGAEC